MYGNPMRKAIFVISLTFVSIVLCKYEKLCKVCTRRDIHANLGMFVTNDQDEVAVNAA